MTTSRTQRSELLDLWPILVVVLLALLYFGSYAALVVPVDTTTPAGYYRGIPVSAVTRDAGYRVGGAATRTVFAPAHWIDAKVRPGHWRPDPTPGMPVRLTPTPPAGSAPRSGR